MVFLSGPQSQGGIHCFTVKCHDIGFIQTFCQAEEESFISGLLRVLSKILLMLGNHVLDTNKYLFYIILCIADWFC